MISHCPRICFLANWSYDRKAEAPSVQKQPQTDVLLVRMSGGRAQPDFRCWEGHLLFSVSLLLPDRSLKVWKKVKRLPLPIWRQDQKRSSPRESNRSAPAHTRVWMVGSALSPRQRKGPWKARGLRVPKQRVRECHGGEMTYKETREPGRADSRLGPADHSCVGL